MSSTVEGGKFEGRTRARGGFGNETGQTERRARNGEAERSNQRAMNRAAAHSAPSGPFKSPVYDASIGNLAKLGQMVGPMIASPGIGLAAPLARAILSDNPYGAFGMPSGWRTYSPRDINPMGGNPVGNIGARDYAQQTNGAAQRNVPVPMPRAEPDGGYAPSVPAAMQSYYPPAFVGNQVAGLPFYGANGIASLPATSPRRKASGYGGHARLAPIPGFPPNF